MSASGNGNIPDWWNPPTDCDKTDWKGTGQKLAGGAAESYIAGEIGIGNLYAVVKLIEFVADLCGQRESPFVAEGESFADLMTPPVGPSPWAPDDQSGCGTDPQGNPYPCP